jgi:hypothetical protein
MTTPSTLSRPIRVAVFSTIEQADRAVDGLLNLGFRNNQISVICSDKSKERHFEAFHHQDSAGSHTGAAAAIGGAIGATLGGFAAVVGTVATGGIALLAAGGIAAWGGAAVGGLVGAMMTRGIEKELANFYDQAVVQGKILVAVDDPKTADSGRLAEAVHVFEQAGAEPVSLPEG